MNDPLEPRVIERGLEVSTVRVRGVRYPVIHRVEPADRSMVGDILVVKIIAVLPKLPMVGGL